MIPLQHQAAVAMAAIDDAKTPLQKHVARQDALNVRSDLEKQLGDDKAMAAFKAAQPQSSVGVWKGGPRVIFMTRADGSKPTAAVALPDGTKVVPIQGQIPVPENQVEAMTARGWKRFNDVLTDQHTGMRDPARPNA
jgi:hypothetical protein